MSSRRINITWGVSRNFTQADLDKVLSGYAAVVAELKSEYEQSVWKVNGLTIKLYERNLVAQGKITTSGVNVVSAINKLSGLSLDRNNRGKMTALKPVSQNALECQECGEHFFLIQSSVEGLDLSFSNECGHKNTVNAPFIMCVNRVLPDINVLKSRNLSRLIELGYFENCEILIPTYMMKCLDMYLSGSKTTVSSELDQLREMEKRGLVDIKNFDDKITIPASRDEFNIEEDTTLLDIADITNSIFITSDINCKDQAILRKRPVIFIDHETTKNTKILHELRTPS